jgi:LPXTG-motif cell wall-anchored protein
MKRTLLVIPAAGLVISLSLTVTSASALDLDTFPAGGETGYSYGYVNQTLWSVSADATSASFTQIGTPSGAATTVLDGAYDPTTGKSWILEKALSGPCELWTVNTDTGEAEFASQVIEGIDTTFEDCRALDILPDGRAFAILDREVLFSLDLTTGAATRIGTTTYEGNDRQPRALTHSPITGLSYAIDNPDNTEWYTIDLTTGNLTDEVTLNMAAPHDADVDANGVIWMLVDSEGYGRLYSTDPTDPNNFVSRADNVGLDAKSFWIVPPPVSQPELPNTGLTVGVLSGSASALALLGLGLVAIRRQRKA